MELDREREHWHNITVIATQRGQSAIVQGIDRYCLSARLAKTLQRAFRSAVTCTHG